MTLNTTTPAWFYQFAGIKSVTSDFSFSNYAHADNGFCIFPVSDTAPRPSTLRGPAVQPEFKLCLNGVGNTYSCEGFAMGDRFAYVVNYNDLVASYVSLCSINSASGLFGNCTTLTPIGFPTNNEFEALNITLSAAGTLAYVTTNGGTGFPNAVFLCTISTDGTLGTCQASGNGLSGPFGIVLNNAGSIAYVTNNAGKNVSVCPVNANGFFGTCTTSRNGFAQPLSIVLF